MLTRFKSSVLPIFKFFIGWPVSVIALFFIIKEIVLPHVKTISSHLQDINFLLLISAILCFIAYYFVRSTLWHNILKEQGYKIPFKESTFLWEMSELKRFIPGSIWSVLGRATHFSQKGISPKIVFKSLIFEAQFLMIGALIISALGNSLSTKSLVPMLASKLFIEITLALITILGILTITFSKYLNTKINKKPFNLITKFFNTFSWQTNLKLSLISCFYMLLFGIGTYLTISSVITLTPNLIVELLSLFVLSFLIGYLSILTPMGLGVREGVVTVGLANLVSLTVAGFASIFSRFIFIFSEIIFLALTFIWYRTKNKYVTHFDKFISSNKHTVILTIMILIYTIYFTSASFIRHDNFYSGRFDLGNMDQTVWNTYRGRIFKLTDPNGTEVISRLAIHADFILIGLAPLYSIWPNPKILLLIQTIIIALGAYFVYLICNIILKNKNLSLALGISFLLNPSIGFSNLYDFHAVAFACTFLLAAFYFILKNKYLISVIFLILAGLTKENVWLITSIFGLYLIIKSKKVLGISIFIASIIISYYLIYHAIPQALGRNHFALSFYTDFGDSPNNVIRNVIFSPHKILLTITQKDRLEYLKQLLFPVGFLPILSPFYLVFTLPNLVINLLSNRIQLYQIFYQYTSTITPFLFISSIFAIKTLTKMFKKIPLSLYSFYVAIYTLISVYFWGPLPFSKNPNIDMFTRPQENKEEIKKAISHIPKKYSIASTNNLGAHLSHRQRIFTVPVGIDKADIIMFLLNYQFENPTFAYERQMLDRVKKDKNYVQVFQESNFYVFHKKGI